MQISSRKYLTIIVILSMTLASLIYIDRGRGASLNPDFRFAGLTLEIGEWKGREVALPERTYEILGTKDVIVREYANPKGETIVVVIVRSSNDRSSFHPPEICYLGGGVKLMEKTVETFNINDSFSLRMNRLVMQDKSGLEVAWYWFAVGDDFTHNYYLQQCRFILNELLRRDENIGALIRVSTHVAGGELSQADGRVKDFIGEVVKIFKKMS